MKKLNHEGNIMKFIFVILIFVFFLISACTSKNISSDNIKTINLIIDPNNRENKLEKKTIISQDSIHDFIKNLNNNMTEPCKFIPRYKIEINYVNTVVIFIGNKNYIKDASGKTYKLLNKESELYNY